MILTVVDQLRYDMIFILVYPAGCTENIRDSRACAAESMPMIPSCKGMPSSLLLRASILRAVPTYAGQYASASAYSAGLISSLAL